MVNFYYHKNKYMLLRISLKSVALNTVFQRNYCRGSFICLYVAKLKIVCLTLDLTLDTWWSLLTPVICQIIKYVLWPNRGPKTYKADSQLKKLRRKTVV